MDENTENLFPGEWNGSDYDNGSGFHFKELGKGDSSNGNAQGRDGKGSAQPSSGASTGVAAEESRPRFAALALLLGLVGFGLTWL